MRLCVIILLGSSFVHANSCNIIPGKLLPVTALKDCVNQISYDKNNPEFNKTIETIKYYLEGYAYRDVMLKVPTPHANSMDILQKLESISSDPSVKDTYTFHERIALALNEMKDAHTYYRMPCGDSFMYLFPYRFIPEADDISSLNPKFIMRVASYELMSNKITDFYLNNFTSAKNLTNKIITHLKIDGIIDIPDEPPEKTLARWADKFISHSRTSPARVMHTITSAFHVRALWTAPLPEKNATITYMPTDGSPETATEDVPFFVASVVNFTNFSDFCPLVSTNDAAITQTPPVRRSRKLTTEGPFQKLEEILEQERLFHTPENPIQKLMKLLETNTFAGLQSRRNDLPTPQILANNDYIVGYYIAEWNLTYMHVKSFSPFSENQAEAFLVGAITTVGKAVSSKSRFVVDLRGNGGGYIHLGILLKHYMYPTHYPINTEVQYVSTDVTNAVEKTFDGATALIVTTDPVTNKRLKGIWSAPATLNTTSVNGTTRTQSWTRRFAFNADRVIASIDPLISSEMKNKRLFSPNDVTILTDGTCGSTCGQFLKHLAEHRLGRIIGLGWDFVGTLGFDVGSFAAGNVINTDAVKQLITPGHAFLQFPRKDQLLSYVMLDSLSHSPENKEERWEFKIIRPDVIYPIFDYLPSINQEGRLSTLQKLLPALNDHYSWEVQDSDCTPTSKKANAVYGHQWSKEKKMFDPSTCVFSHCLDTHYLNDAGNCVERPPWFNKEGEDPTNNPTKEPNKMNGATIAAIVVGVVVFVGCLVVGIVLFVWYMQKKKKVRSSDSMYSRTELKSALL